MCLAVNPKVIGVSVIPPQAPGNSSKAPKAPSGNSSKGLKILDSGENEMFPFTQPRSQCPGEEREICQGCSAKVLSK